MCLKKNKIKYVTPSFSHLNSVCVYDIVLWSEYFNLTVSQCKTPQSKSLFIWNHFLHLSSYVIIQCNAYNINAHLIVCIWASPDVYSSDSSCARHCQTEHESLWLDFTEGLAASCFSNSITDQIRQQWSCQHLCGAFIVELQSKIQCQPVGICHEKSLYLQTSLSARQKDTVLCVWVDGWLGEREGTSWEYVWLPLLKVVDLDQSSAFIHVSVIAKNTTHKSDRIANIQRHENTIKAFLFAHI